MANVQVVIVGRPNVGKSSIFNWLAGRRLAIVDDMAGVTRDRVIHLMEHEGRRLRAGRHRRDGHRGRRQPDGRDRRADRLAMAAADVVLFVVDMRAGMVPLDRKSPSAALVNKPVLWWPTRRTVRNSIRRPTSSTAWARTCILRVSTLQNRNRTALLDAIVERLPEAVAEAANRTGDEGGHRRPPQRGQEHVHQHAGRQPSG